MLLRAYASPVSTPVRIAAGDDRGMGGIGQRRKNGFDPAAETAFPKHAGQTPVFRKGWKIRVKKRVQRNQDSLSHHSLAFLLPVRGNENRRERLETV